MLRIKPKKVTILRKGKALPPRYMAAYGSNLNLAQMARRCPKAVPVASLYLKGKILRFRGVADMIDRKRNKCPVGIWKITPECERELDIYEGVSHGLYVKKYVALEVEGVIRPVLYYQMTRGGIMPPADYYYRGIVKGYQDFGLDDRFLQRALDHSWERKNRTDFLDRRYAKKGSPPLARLDDDDDEDDCEEMPDAVDEFIEKGWAERMEEERAEIDRYLREEGIL